MMTTLTTRHGDGTVTTMEHDGELHTILATVEELLASPAVTNDPDAEVSIVISTGRSVR